MTVESIESLSLRCKPHQSALFLRKNYGVGFTSALYLSTHWSEGDTERHGKSVKAVIYLQFNSIFSYNLQDQKIIDEPSNRLLLLEHPPVYYIF